MTGLFERVRNGVSLQNPKQIIVDVPDMAQEVPNVELPQNTLSSAIPFVPQDTQNEDAKEVNGDLSLSQNDSPKPFQPVDLGESDDIQFGGEKTPTDAILEMAGDDEAFAVKGVAPNPSGFSAAQIQADYHEELFGKDNIASRMLRDLCVWQSRYNSSGKKGERAKQVFGALGSAKQEEFQLEKETKGLLNK